MIQMIFGSPVVIIKGTNVEQLFPTIIYEEILNYLTNKNNNFTDHPLSKGGKIFTTAEYLNSEMWINSLDKLPFLLDFLKKLALDHAYLYTADTIKDIKLHSSWINLTFKGCEINNHNDRSNHNDKSIIVLFYPRAPEGSSDLVFIHDGKEGEWVSDRLEKDLVRILIDEGDIVIFDNFLYHAVDAHNTDIPRMCVALEFTIEK